MYQKTERENNIIYHEFMERLARRVSESQIKEHIALTLFLDSEDFTFFFDLFNDKKNELELKLRESK